MLVKHHYCRVDKGYNTREVGCCNQMANRACMHVHFMVHLIVFKQSDCLIYIVLSNKWCLWTKYFNRTSRKTTRHGIWRVCTMCLVGPLCSGNERAQHTVQRLWHPTIHVGWYWKLNLCRVYFGISHKGGQKQTNQPTPPPLPEINSALTEVHVLTIHKQLHWITRNNLPHSNAWVHNTYDL